MPPAPTRTPPHHRGTAFITLAAGRNGDGRLDLYGVSAGQAYLRSQQTEPGGSWTDWAPFGYLPTGWADLDAETNVDGHLTVFGVDPAGAVFQRTQGTPTGSWSAWTAFGTVGDVSAEVPDVSGMTAYRASQTLQASFFSSKISYFVDLTCENIGTVATQSPQAGTVARLGTVVTVSIGTKPPGTYVCP